MAWTAPADWTTGQVVDADDMNTQVRDNLLQTLTAKVTTAGDTGYATGANALSRLGIGTKNKKLKVNDGATAPEWGDEVAGGWNAVDAAMTVDNAWHDLISQNLTPGNSGGNWLVIGGFSSASDAGAHVHCQVGIGSSFGYPGRVTSGSGAAEYIPVIATAIISNASAAAQAVKLQYKAESGGCAYKDPWLTALWI